MAEHRDGLSETSPMFGAGTVQLKEAAYKELPKTWQEGEYTVTRSYRWGAPGCHTSCGVLYYVKNGKLEKVEGDPDSPWFNGRLCPRCLVLAEAVNHPDRLKYPMVRAGERGEGKWKRISWDEAYDLIEENIKRITEKYGAETICCLNGTGRITFGVSSYFTYAGVGSPNECSGFLSGESCYLPRACTMGIMDGNFVIMDANQCSPLSVQDNPDYQIPEWIVIWGNNPLSSNPDGFMGHFIVDLMKLGSKLITIDPRVTWLAARSEYHVQLRPGTDGALALSMLNVIINEDLYDHEFVETWTHGFEQLRERVQEYPVERAAEICGIEPELIRSVARAYALGRPSAIQWGLAVDTTTHGVGAAHAINCLWAICGFVEKPGTQIAVGLTNLPIVNADMDYGVDLLPEGQLEKRYGRAAYPMYSFFSSAQADTHLKALESGKPYYPRMYWTWATNPIANMSAASGRVYNAIKNGPIEFYVASDIFMTPSMQAFADLVLPVAMAPELNSARQWWAPTRALTRAEGLEPDNECKSDLQISLEMGKRLKPENFPWNSTDEWLDELLLDVGRGGIGMTKARLEEQGGIFYDQMVYQKHEKGLLRRDGQPGFNTMTGKIELYSTLFEMWGYDPLPYYHEPIESPVSTPQMAKEYPLVLTTGARSWMYFHSEGRQLKTAREIHPLPMVQIHPDTAAAAGIINGDWVWIENAHGRCKQMAEVTPTIRPDVIQADHGWWFPEKEAAEPSLYGNWECNINLLTTQCDNGPYGPGAPYKTQLCKIYRAEGGI